jgi:hypothetical protein
MLVANRKVTIKAIAYIWREWSEPERGLRRREAGSSWGVSQKPGGKGERIKEQKRNIPEQVEPFWRTFSRNWQFKEMWRESEGGKGRIRQGKREKKTPDGLGIARLWLAPARSYLPKQ